MNLTWDQISGLLDRVVLVVLTYAVSKGYITSADVGPIAAAILALGGAIWGWWVNRPKAIVQSAAALPGTTVVTTPGLAASTPQQNIVSSATSQVVNK